jgi:hypothetical protein
VVFGKLDSFCNVLVSLQNESSFEKTITTQGVAAFPEIDRENTLGAK